LHRYLREKQIAKFCYEPATSAASSKGIFAAATNSTNQTSKAGGTFHIPLISLSFLDVYGSSAKFGHKHTRKSSQGCTIDMQGQDLPQLPWMTYHK